MFTRQTEMELLAFVFRSFNTLLFAGEGRSTISLHLKQVRTKRIMNTLTLIETFYRSTDRGQRAVIALP